MSQRRYDSMRERLVANSQVPDGQSDSGCWEWTGPTSGGYGIVAVRKPGKRNPQGMLAHREMVRESRAMAAQLASDDARAGDWWNTPLPGVAAPPMSTDQETVDHLCCNRRCVNPDHLQLISRTENSRLRHQRRR